MSFRFHCDILQCFSVFPPACLAETQFADEEDSWSSFVFSRENNCVMRQQDCGLGWASTAKSCSSSEAHNSREVLALLNLPLQSSLHRKLEGRIGQICPRYRVTYLTASLRTGTVSCGLGTGELEKPKEKRICARNGASPISLTWKGCVCLILSI